MARARRRVFSTIAGSRGSGSKPMARRRSSSSFAWPRFRSAPNPHVVETPRHIAVFDGERAISPICTKATSRDLWALGGDGFPARAGCWRSRSIPIGAGRAATCFCARRDHPDLAAEAAGRVKAAGRAIVARSRWPDRTRAFVIRAFGHVDDVAPRYSRCYRLRPVGRTWRASGYTAARWDSNGHDLVRIAAARRRWRPAAGRRVSASDDAGPAPRQHVRRAAVDRRCARRPARRSRCRH